MNLSEDENPVVESITPILPELSEKNITTGTPKSPSRFLAKSGRPFKSNHLLLTKNRSTRNSIPKRSPIHPLFGFNPFSPLLFTPHSPISILSDSQFASSAFPGSGTSEDPYRIEGYNITNSVGALIQICNTTVHFCIKGNWLSGLGQAANGIELQNVTRGTVDNNTIYHTAKDGISLRSSTNNMIIENRVQGSNQMGITVRQSNSNTISHNSLSSNNLIGIFVRESEHNLVTSNSVDNHTLSNIYLAVAANNTVTLNTCSDNYNGIVLNCADNNTLMSNNCYNHWGSGIYAEDSSNNYIWQNICAYNGGGVVIVTSGEREIYSSGNVVFSNYIYENNGGINLEGCSRSSLSSNNIHDNHGSGIHLSATTLAILANSTIYNNAGDGISLDSCNATTIFGNNVFNNEGAGFTLSASVNTAVTLNNFHDNDHRGIWVRNSEFNAFSKNAVFGNRAEGIRIENSKANNITRNNFDGHHSGSGIYLYFSQSHILSGNTISNNNWYGIALENADSNIISNNTVEWNVGYGVLLGTWQAEFSLSSDNNTVKLNAFSGNNDEYCQAFDGGLDNAFICNYWDDWTNPDVDTNNWVDSPYLIDSSGDYQHDLYPLVTPSAHVLIPFTLTYPNGGEKLSDNVILQWTASEDSLGHSIVYAVYYSVDKGELWTLIASNFTDTSFVWNPRSSEIHGSNCLIKVTVNCCEGLMAEDISDGTFAIAYGADNPSNPDTLFLAILALLILSASLGYFLFNAKFREQPSFNDFIQSSPLDYLQTLYHKVIIALENIKLPPIAHPVGIPTGAVTEQGEGASLSPPSDSITVQRLDALDQPGKNDVRSASEPLGVPHPDSADQTAITTYFPPEESIGVPTPDLADPAILINYFPPNIRQDLKSDMRGRTVLALIEIAYQYPNEINPTKLSKILDVPATTISDEIKRLLKMEYIESVLSAKTLRDARYKYYSITQKGATFLHILKGTLNLAIQHLREMEHDIVM